MKNFKVGGGGGKIKNFGNCLSNEHCALTTHLSPRSNTGLSLSNCSSNVKFSSASHREGLGLRPVESV
jgi:hypothetical protein